MQLRLMPKDDVRLPDGRVMTIRGFKTDGPHIEKARLYSDGHAFEYADPADLTHVFVDESKAAAYLATEAFSKVALRAYRRGSLVKVWVNGRGKNFSNISRAFDLSPGEVGPADAYNGTDVQSKPERAEAYANFIVDGVHDPTANGWGYGMPLYDNRKDGSFAIPLSELDSTLIKAAVAAGVDLEPNRRAERGAD